MYSFYLDKVMLPVPPPKLTLSIKNQNKTLDLMNLGEVNVLKKVGLTEINFEALLPGNPYPFAVYDGGFKKPSFYLALLKKLKVDQKPFLFVVSRFSPSGEYLFGTSMEVSLEDYSILESADAGQDITVSVKLKEFRPYATQLPMAVLSTDQGTAVLAEAAPERPAKEPVKSYTVKAGDTLWAICKKELGDGGKYATVAAANGIKNPNLIYPGQVISLEVT